MARVGWRVEYKGQAYICVNAAESNGNAVRSVWQTVCKSCEEPFNIMMPELFPFQMSGYLRVRCERCKGRTISEKEYKRAKWRPNMFYVVYKVVEFLQQRYEPNGVTRKDIVNGMEQQPYFIEIRDLFKVSSYDILKTCLYSMVAKEWLAQDGDCYRVRELMPGEDFGMSKPDVDHIQIG